MLGNQYRIVSELGAGGMGVVYQAVDVMLEREVAIKKLRNEFTSTPEVAERFRREAKIQARLNHPNIAHLYSFFKDGEAFYMVMEFVSGTRLRSLLPMPWDRCLNPFLQILDSLEYAHSLGVLHRDLKPDNVMVTARGEVKVMDFGIAHVLGQARQTRDKSIVGTLEYVPPELILGKNIDQRSDIYSLGVLLFEMVTGRVPFDSPVEFELLKQHLEATPPRVTSFVPSAPEFLEKAIARALSKNPDERFANCGEFAAYLKANAPERALTNDGKLGLAHSDDIDRCVHRISALASGGEIEVADSVLRNALADYPGDVRLAACQDRLREERQRRAASQEADEKLAYLRDTLARLSDMEAAGDVAACRDFAQSALEQQPKAVALQIAAAHFKRKLAEA